MSHLQLNLLIDLVKQTDNAWYSVEIERDKVAKYENKKRDLILRLLIHKRKLSEDISYIALNFIEPTLDNLSKFEFQLDTIMDIVSYQHYCSQCYAMVYNALKEQMDEKSDRSWRSWRIRNNNTLYEYDMSKIRPNFGLSN